MLSIICTRTSLNHITNKTRLRITKIFILYTKGHNSKNNGIKFISTHTTAGLELVFTPASINQRFTTPSTRETEIKLLPNSEIASAKTEQNNICNILKNLIQD